MIGQMDAKKKALEELMGYLDGKDGEELGGALAPKPDVAPVEAVGIEPGVEEVAIEGVEKPELSEEEIAELIEALQSKLG